MRRLTYRCSDELNMRVQAIKQKTGWSFQRLTDEFYQTLLYKMQYEGQMFNDLLATKQVEYTVKDILERPVFKRFFSHKT